MPPTFLTLGWTLNLWRHSKEGSYLPQLSNQRDKYSLNGYGGVLTYNLSISQLIHLLTLNKTVATVVQVLKWKRVLQSCEGYISLGKMKYPHIIIVVSKFCRYQYKNNLEVANHWSRRKTFIFLHWVLSGPAQSLRWVSGELLISVISPFFSLPSCSSLLPSCPQYILIFDPIPEGQLLQTEVPANPTFWL